MNKDNAAQYLPLVQALAEGKKIQVRDSLSGAWRDQGEFVLDCSPHDYRVKPEPREFFIAFEQDGSAHGAEVRFSNVMANTVQGMTEVLKRTSTKMFSSVIKVREIID